MAQSQIVLHSSGSGVSNTGTDKLPSNKSGVVKGIVVDFGGEGFATVSDASTLAAWVTDFKKPKATRKYFFPKFSTIADKSTDDTMSESLIGMQKDEKGVLSFMAEMDLNTYNAVGMKSWDGKKCPIYLIYDSNTISGFSPDGAKFKGYNAMILVGNRKFAEKGKSEMVNVTIILDDSDQKNLGEVVIEASQLATPFYPLSDFNGVYNVNVTLSNTTAAGTTISVKLDGVDPLNSDGWIGGLVKADFVQKSSAGVVKSITSTDDNFDGTFACVSTIANGDTFDLVACGSISITTIMIESTGAATAVVA